MIAGSQVVENLQTGTNGSQTKNKHLGTIGSQILPTSERQVRPLTTLDGKDVPVKPQFLEPVDPKYWAEIKAVNERITRLQQECDLDPMDDVALEFLRRRTCFTQRQMLLLERIEQDYVLTGIRALPIC